MGKIKDFFRQKKNVSLKWGFALYLPLCLIISYLGVMAIGVGTNYLQDWYRGMYSTAPRFIDYKYEIYIDEDGKARSTLVGAPSYDDHNVVYWIISNAQVLLMPIWVMFCLAATGRIFYDRELKEPINTLMDAAEKISENKLDFEVYYYKKNELGKLCEAFNEMRRALYENNRELWHSLEERKRLNAAFSHDLRTPLTVLRGYAELLEKYVPDGKFSEEKLMSVLGKMKGQIDRLENYTVKMNAVQKLDDILPKREDTSFSRLCGQLSETGRLICGEKNFILTAPESDGIACIDTELVMQVFENLVSDGVRYAESCVRAKAELDGDVLRITVSDDGAGFSADTLKYAAEPFYRGDNEQNRFHFGLGLYICRIICEKCGGRLFIANGEKGGTVTAEFLNKPVSDTKYL